MGLFLMVSLCGTVFAQMDFPVDPNWQSKRLRYGMNIDAYSIWVQLDDAARWNIAYGVVVGKEVFAEYVMYFYGDYQVKIDLTDMRPNTMSTGELVDLVNRVYKNTAFQGIPFADIMISCYEWDQYLRRK